ncbi:gliding motility-associated C-terminal domain-containing protein [Bacteroidota bacterium]
MNKLLSVFIFILVSCNALGHTHDGGIFIKNQGQWNHEVLYRLDIPSGKMYLTKTGIRYTFYHAGKIEGPHGHHHAESENARQANPYLKDLDKPQAYNVFLDFLEANEQVTVTGKEKVSAYYNFYQGNDPGKWASGVPAYREIVYRDIYKDTDLRFYFNNGALKYDLVLRENADPRDIQFHYRGFEALETSYNSIHLHTTLNTIIDNPPYAYQKIDKETKQVSCRYNLSESTIRFDLPEGYNKNEELVIDPALVFSTYSGSTADNWGNTATFDENGNVYSGGTVRLAIGGYLHTTPGVIQPEFGGVWDLAILKFDSLGEQLLYSTYLGGRNTETPFSLIVNKNDELLVLGITGSDDFPVTDNAFSRTFQGGDTIRNVINGISYMRGSDLFISKISSDGRTLIASTYLGGMGNDGINWDVSNHLSKNYGDEFRGEINIDRHDNVYIVSNTASVDFPIINGFQEEHGGGTLDGIITKLSPDLDELIWSSYLGGAGNDCAYSIKIKDDSTVYVTGGTVSRNFPTSENALHPDYQGGIDGFVSKIGNHGSSLSSSTYLGTFEYEQAYFLDIDFEDYIYVFGQTRGDYPVTVKNVYVNPLSGQFIHKLSPDLNETIWSTVIGSGSGIPDISPTAFMVNECGNIYLSGWGGTINTLSPKYVGGNTYNMPITANAIQDLTDGSDFYLMVLERDAKSLLYGTYLGAFLPGQSGEHVDGGTCRFDRKGIVYHAICACRDFSEFPTTPGAYSNVNGSLGGEYPGCNNGVFKFDLSALKCKINTNTPDYDNLGIKYGCAPFDLVFLNESIGGQAFRWKFGDGEETTVKDSIPHTYESPGIYKVTLTGYDENTCKLVDVAMATIHVYEDHFELPVDSVTICTYENAVLKAGGAVTYTWNPADGMNDTSLAEPTASPDSTTVYYLLMVDMNGCEMEDSVLVRVIPEIRSDFIIDKQYDCLETPTIALANLSSGADRYFWNFGKNEPEEIPDSLLTYHFEEKGNYTVLLESRSQGRCIDTKTENIYISDIFIPNVITPNGDKKNDTFVITTDAVVDLSIHTRWGKELYKSHDYQNNWGAEGLSTGIYYYDILLNNETSCNGWIHVLK